MSQLQVAAFTQGMTVPSARFRVRQHVSALQAEGIALHEWPARHGSYPPAGLLPRMRWLPRSLAERYQALREAEETCAVALFQREMLSTLPSVERCWRKPAVLDVDDAIWLDQRFGAAERIARHCGLVLCGNAYLADWFSRHAAVEVIPTAVDTAYYRPGVAASQPLIVWSGSASGHPYLEAISGALRTVLELLPEARLRVVSNAPARLVGLPEARVEQVMWSPQCEVAAVNEAWVGLMPMPDTAWTRGKCSFKMLSYLACGVPAVVSPWGMNGEVLAQGEVALGAHTETEWVDALLSLLRDASLRARMGAAGRALVEQRYSCAVVAPRIAAALRSRV